jgi:hypothetical protein
MIDLSHTVAEVLPSIESCDDRDALEKALGAASRVTVRRALEARLEALGEPDAPAAPVEEADEESDRDSRVKLRKALHAQVLAAIKGAAVPHPITGPLADWDALAESLGSASDACIALAEDS